MRSRTWTRWLTRLGMLFAPALTADELSLSHVVVVTDNALTITGIDYPPIERFCGDSDGCQVVFRLERATGASTATARLFVNAGEVAGRWFSSGTSGRLLQ